MFVAFMEQLFTSQGLISLVTLTFLEIVLGIDNIVFISLTTSRVAQENQQRARVLGISLALLVRIGLLMVVGWIISLRNPLFTLFDFDISYRDLILIAGGMFLIGKSVSELHAKLEGKVEGEESIVFLSFRKAIVQIILLDIVFSLDSIITAVGLVENLLIIVIAIVISLVVMLIFSNRISNFINDHPTIKLLAISFLLMIGTMLVVEGLHVHVPKGYIYFAMAFALGIELLNMRVRKKSKLLRKENATAGNVKVKPNSELH
jgi:predicted tellurium resistance membrane protein TerC